ncbi:MAG: DUF3667 domain-containing protein [Gemmatimonadaceae bacterium]
MATPIHQPPASGSSLAPDDRSCANCGSRLVQRYCADCGQPAPGPRDYSIRAHAAEFVDQLASVDGKIGRTLWALVARPGALTVDHLAGRRARYLRPLQLFLVVNVLLFVIAPRVPMFTYSLRSYLTYAPPSPVVVASLVRRTSAATDRSAYTAAFDARVESQRKSLIILFAPALALLFRVLFARRTKRAGVPHRYGEHLVFALHLLAFIWLAVTGWGALGTLSSLAPTRTLNVLTFVLLVALFAATPVYLLRALARVYDLTRIQSLAVLMALLTSFVGLVVAYRTLLFFATYYSLN